LRKNRKELFKCGLSGVLVHAVLPYFRDYGQGLPYLYYKGFFLNYQVFCNLIFIILQLSWLSVT
jgi:hypothetical protein